ncbi:hypothetical protein CLONEX_01092 [[Clostridium] nexile DSM 1787]|nr:hypothetical protein CLONEX_01092 [[Clostridium] nexile DSM 1787]
MNAPLFLICLLGSLTHQNQKGYCKALKQAYFFVKFLFLLYDVGIKTIKNFVPISIAP